MSGWKSQTYGIRLNKEDRDKYFNKKWKTVFLDLCGNGVIKVSISKSFWNKCPELRKKEIGEWFVKNGKVPWKDRDTPKMEMIPAGGNKFKVMFT